MKARVGKRHSCRAVEIFQPRPNLLYGLDVAAHLAGVPRRAILIYCRAGLVTPVSLPPYGAMAFTDEAIHTVRRIERLRSGNGVNLAWLKTMLDLVAEVERLRAEVRFLRSNGGAGS
jgi:DNA-binding transcriptional MerR regulator